MSLSEFEEDWKILRSKAPDRITITMNVGEALSRLTRALRTFFALEEPTEVFGIIIENQLKEKLGTEVLFRVRLTGLKSEEILKWFDPVMKAPWQDDLEKAVEQAFTQVVAIFKEYNERVSECIQKEEAELLESKGQLLKLERNLQGMGLYNPEQPPLPFPEPAPVISATS